MFSSKYYNQAAHHAVKIAQISIFEGDIPVIIGHDEFPCNIKTNEMDNFPFYHIFIPKSKYLKTEEWKEWTPSDFWLHDGTQTINARPLFRLKTLQKPLKVYGKFM